jgi:hypothetical protein
LVFSIQFRRVEEFKSLRVQKWKSRRVEELEDANPGAGLGIAMLRDWLAVDRIKGNEKGTQNEQQPKGYQGRLRKIYE